MVDAMNIQCKAPIGKSLKLEYFFSRFSLFRLLIFFRRKIKNKDGINKFYDRK